jgi:hypothetical protein
MVWASPKFQQAAAALARRSRTQPALGRRHGAASLEVLPSVGFLSPHHPMLTLAGLYPTVFGI